MRYRSVVRAAAPLLTLSLVLVACGDDDDEASAEDNTELCALAEEQFEKDDFPTAAYIDEYAELAPDEIEDAVDTAGDAIRESDGDPAKFYAAAAEDDVEDAIFEIDAWEIENCGIEHDDPYPEEANEIDPDATRVDVVASEYSFDFDKEIPAGATSFVMTNPGAEVHFMTFAKILEGHTLEEALAFEGDAEAAGLVEAGEYDSGLAAPGGEDEEAVTLDMTAGSWVMLCFVPGPDGTPHAFTGMAVPFTVT